MRALAATLLTIWIATAEASEQSWSKRDLELVRSLAISELGPAPPSPSNRYSDDPEATKFGRRLFLDKRFSKDGTVSCATCHDPEKQFQDSRALAVGIGTASRRTMPLVGVAYSPFLFWDGRADSLWSQALGPLENAVEHGGDRTGYAHLIAEHYREPYEAVFGPMPSLLRLPPRAGPVPDPVARAAWSGMSAADRRAMTTVFVNIGKAIEAFERTLHPAPTRFDTWTASTAFPSPGLLDSREIEGLRLFIGRAGCINCHNGPLLTNHSFHNTGVPPGPASDVGRSKGLRMLVISRFNCRGTFSDAGERQCPELRFLSKGDHVTEGAFKTPGLRGVAERPPYMHAGQFATLQEVVNHYATAPRAMIGHSELQPLHLTDNEKRALERFLMTLSP